MVLSILLGLTQGDNKNNSAVVWGLYLSRNNVPNSESDVRSFPRIPTQNQPIGGPVTVTLEPYFLHQTPEPPVITSPTATPGTTWTWSI